MKHSMLRRLSWVVLVALATWFAVGCAKKVTEAPPAPPPPPPPVPTQTEPKPPEPPPPPEPKLRSSDLQAVFFDFDSYAIREDGRRALDANARLLRDNADVNITIEGHCDERGTVEYNLALGEKRAQAARDYMAASGVDAGRLRTVSYGEERPFDAGHDETAWAKNRRAHFVIR